MPYRINVSRWRLARSKSSSSFSLRFFADLCDLCGESVYSTVRVGGTVPDSSAFRLNLEATMADKRPDQQSGDPTDGSSTKDSWRGQGRSREDAADAGRGQKIPKGTDEESRDRVDEASEESFPASDPPQQP